MEEILENASPVQGELAADRQTEGLTENDNPSVGKADSSLYTREPLREHIESLCQQGRAFKQAVPDFDLRRELQNPMFARLTSPYVGLSVEDAYYALHRRQMQQQAARITAAGISRSVQAGRLRPEENSGAQAASLTKTDYAHASKQQREELKREIHKAAAMGKKIYP